MAVNKICDLAERKISRKLLSSRRFYQFRLAFDKTQAKGSFKVMADELAEALEGQSRTARKARHRCLEGERFRCLRGFL
jgi:hypothetical protein